MNPRNEAQPVNPWLHRFALLTAMATLGLIVIGGLVTSHEAGMAVPDWPNTYGYNMFLFPFSKWVGGILYEHSHRLMAAFVGLLTTVLAIWLWIRETRGAERWLGIAGFALVIGLMGIRVMPVYVTLACMAPMVIGFSIYSVIRNISALRWWGTMAFAAVILQGVLGGLRVVWLKDQIGIFHATLAQLFFALTCAIGLFTSRYWAGFGKKEGHHRSAGLIHRLLLSATLLILLQLILGATMRHQHAGLAIPDFPLAYGHLWPAMDPASLTHYNQQRLETIGLNPITGFQIGLQMMHRMMALLICALVAICAWRAGRQLGVHHPLSRLTQVWLGLILTQALFGAATIWFNKAADIATAHVLIGALALALGVIVSIISARGLVLAQDYAIAEMIEPGPFGTQASAAMGFKITR